MSEIEKIFYVETNNNMVIIPCGEMVLDLLSQQQDVTIKNGHSSIIITGKTLQKIKSESHQKQQRIKAVLYCALQDTSRIIYH